MFYAGDLGTIYESEVIAASHSGIGSPRKHARRYWGDRPVLILIGLKLGPNSVNEIYYTAVKVCVLSNGDLAILKVSVGILEVAPVYRHRRRPTVFIVLLRRLTSRFLVLPGSPSCETHNSFASSTTHTT